MTINESNFIFLEKSINGPFYDFNIDSDVLRQLQDIDSTTALLEDIFDFPLELVISHVLFTVRSVNKLDPILFLDHSNDVSNVSFIKFLGGIGRCLLDLLELAL
jgi:hypothetical protein